MGWILSGMMLLVLAGIVILNLFRGKKRGVVRTGISVCILIASAFAAIIASRKVSVVIAEAIVTAMRKSDDMQEVLHELPSLAPFITAAIGMLISVTVFFVFYYALRGILNLIAFLILKATGFQKDHVPSGKDKTFGALMGILLGVMVFCVLSMPLVGYLTLADSACGALIENGGEEVDELAKDDINLCDVQNNVIHPLASSRMVTETGRITNRLLFTPLTTYQVDGRRTVLLDETTALCRVAGGSIAVATILDKSTEITDRQMKILETLADDFGNSASVNAVMALPEGERVAALSDLATKRLNEYGVEVPQNIADTVAEAMLTDLAGGDITAEGMQEFFRKYAASSSIETYVPEFRSDMP